MSSGAKECGSADLKRLRAEAAVWVAPAAYQVPQRRSREGATALVKRKSAKCRGIRGGHGRVCLCGQSPRIRCRRVRPRHVLARKHHWRPRGSPLSSPGSWQSRRNSLFQGAGHRDRQRGAKDARAAGWNRMELNTDSACAWRSIARFGESFLKEAKRTLRWQSLCNVPSSSSQAIER